jgi:hypothetical protein
MRPHFRSLDELLAHTRGNGWTAIVAEFEAEYGSFDLTNLPQRQRINHPLASYDRELCLFYHFSSFHQRSGNVMVFCPPMLSKR